MIYAQTKKRITYCLYRDDDFICEAKESQIKELLYSNRKKHPESKWTMTKEIYTSRRVVLNY